MAKKEDTSQNPLWRYMLEYFADRFLPGTYINNVDCSLLTAEQTRQTLQENIGKYEIELVERGDRTEYVTGEALGLSYVDDGSVDELIKAQDSELWLYYLNVRGDYNLPASFDYDESYVSFLVEELDCMDEDNVIEPENAYIEQSSEGFYIVPEVEGTEVGAFLLMTFDGEDEDEDTFRPIFG